MPVVFLFGKILPAADRAQKRKRRYNKIKHLICESENGVSALYVTYLEGVVNHE